MYFPMRHLLKYIFKLQTWVCVNNDAPLAPPVAKRAASFRAPAKKTTTIINANNLPPTSTNKHFYIVSEERATVNELLTRHPKKTFRFGIAHTMITITTFMIIPRDSTAVR